MTTFDAPATAAASSIFAQRLARWVIEVADTTADTIAAQRARRATLRALDGLDARLLDDIGVTRADIDALR